MGVGTVFITGASSGIGAATARRFAAEGWSVAATMRDPAKAPADLGPADRVAAIRLDVTDPAGVRAAVAATLDRFGPADVVVNNAGFAVVGPFEDAAPEEVRRQFDTNVLGLFDVTRAWLPHLRERGRGTIVNVASVGGRVAFPLYSLYHATKWAVEGFSESLRYELEPLGLRVRIVEPGPIRTDFYGRSAAPASSGPGLSAYADYAARVLPRLAKAGMTGASPESVARVIYRAAVDRSGRLRYSANSAAILAARKLLPDWIFAKLVRAGSGH